MIPKNQGKQTATPRFNYTALAEHASASIPVCPF